MPTDEQAKAQAEEYLAELPDDEFAAVLKRVRPPGPNELPPAEQFAAILQHQLTKTVKHHEQ